MKVLFQSLLAFLKSSLSEDAAILGFGSLKERSARFKVKLTSRPLFYWITAGVFLVIATAISWHYEDQPDLLSIRYRMFDWATRLDPRSLEPRFVKVLEIGDDEFYSDRMGGGRIPSRRDYVAALINILANDKYDANLIALDFNWALTTQNVPKDLATETDRLIRAIVAAASEDRYVILPRRIDWGGQTYVVLPDILDKYGLCVEHDRAWSNPGRPGVLKVPRNAAEHIRCGYINLPFDMRRLPPSVVLDSGTQIDSFALAIAKALQPHKFDQLGRDRYYGSYIARDIMKEHGVILSAHDVLSGDTDTKNTLRRQAIIVGGAWRTDGGRGPYADTHYTPIGSAIGVDIHHNFVEALLDGRGLRPIPDWFLHALDILFGAFAVLVFAGLANFAEKIITVFALSAILLFSQAAMLLVVGTFFDAFLPLFGVLLHSLLDRLFEWHGGKARAHD